MVVGLLVAGSGLSGSAATAQTLTSVAETKTLDYTPLGPGYSYSRIAPTIAISDGVGPRLVFRADAKLAPEFGGPQTQRGFFVDDPADPGSGELVAEIGGVSPEGTVYSALRNRPFVEVPSVNSLGEAAWLGRVRSGAQGLFRGYDPLSASAVALVGDDAGIGGGERIGQIYSPTILDSGDVVFAAGLRGGSVRVGYFLCDNFSTDCSSLGTAFHTPIVLPGDIVDSGREICALNRTLAASAYGIAFTATTSFDCNTSGGMVQGVYRMEYFGPIEAIAETGDLAEPLVWGTTYGRLAGGHSEVALSDEGHVAFRVQIQGPLRGYAIYMCNPLTCPAIDLPVQVVRDGIPAPNGGSFGRFSHPSVNNFGDVVFQSNLRGGPRQGIYLWLDFGGSGVIESVAERGDELFSLDGYDAKITQLRHAPVMSPSGTIAFVSKLRIANGPSPVAILAYE